MSAIQQALCVAHDDDLLPIHTEEDCELVQQQVHINFLYARGLLSYQEREEQLTRAEEQHRRRQESEREARHLG